VKKVTKGSAFAYSLIAILLIALAAFLFKADPESVASASLTAVIALATAFITGNVADNGVKGKFYQEGLNKDSNNGEGK